MYSSPSGRRCESRVRPAYLLPNPLSIKNFSSRTPSEIAALSGYFEIATALNEIARINRIQISHTDTPIAFDSHGPVPNSRKRSSRGVDEVLDKRRKFTGKPANTLVV